MPVTTPEAALAFIRQHCVVMASAKGRAPRLTEAIVGGPIKGSWWAHPQSHRIVAILQAVAASDQVLACRLLDGKVTLVHRRLWPALVGLAPKLAPEQVAKVVEEHTASGRHATHEIPFPDWVPPDVLQQAKTIGEAEAVDAFIAWLPPPKRRLESK